MRYLLDTNVCVNLLRGDRLVAQFIEAVGVENCNISEITKAELLVGANMAKAKGRKIDESMLTEFFKILVPVPIGNCLEYFAVEKVRLRLDGMPIEDFDLLIGCTAVCEGMIMISDNVEHMKRISGIRLESIKKMQTQL